MTTLEMIQEYHNEVIKPILPHSLINNWTRKGDLLTFNLKTLELFKNSKFENDSKEFDFIHFTSISNLFKILQNQYFLLSNLNSFQDENEFHLANKSLENFWTNPDFEKIKSQIFAFSMCPYTNENIKSESLWSNYGHNKKGVCIRFLVNSSIFLTEYFLGKIQYCPDEPIKEIDQVKQRDKEFYEQNGWKISNLNDALSVLLSLYKLDHFHFENEIRIIKYIPEDHLSLYYPSVQMTYEDNLDKITLRYRLPFEYNNIKLITIKEVLMYDSFESPIFYQISNYLDFLNKNHDFKLIILKS